MRWSIVNLGPVSSFDVGLDGPDDTVAALVDRDAKEADGCDRHLI